MKWDVVDADFGGDETVNFGPRKESGTALYQINTLATVSSRDQNDYCVPHIVTSVLGDFALISVDCHLSVFKDCQYCVTVDLGATVDTAEWSPDGFMLVIGDVQGRLYVVDTDSLKIVLTTTVCEPDTHGHAFRRIAFDNKYEDKYSLVILGCNGKLMLLPDISKEVFLSVDEQSNVGAMVMSKMCTAQTIDLHTEGVFDVIYADNHIFTMGSGSHILALWKPEDGGLQLVDNICNSMLIGDAGIRLGRLTSEGTFLFLLDTNHCLTLWNAHMFVKLREMSDQVQEFLILETQEIRNHSLSGMKIVIMTLPTEGEQTCTLLIQDLPSCETVYTLQLSAPTFLSNCSVYQESLYVAECCTDPSTQIVMTVRYRYLTETDPETRLHRILNKKQFEEAEQFAKLFQLDVEIVHKEKLNYLLEQLSPWNVKKHDENTVTEMKASLITCLECIKDDLHVSEIGMMAAMPDITTTRKLLAYCRQRLIKHSAKTSEAKNNKVQHLMAKICDIQNRFDTFKIVFGDKNYSGEKWEKFLAADLMHGCFLLINQGNFEAAQYIWIRHQTECEKYLTGSMIEMIVSTIPDNLTSSEVLRLVRDNLIPLAARLFPEKMKNITDWTIEKAKNMELLEKKNWPLNSISFLKSILKALTQATEISHSSIMPAESINKTRLNEKETVEPVRTLITNLQHLYGLHHKYKCKLTFDQFMQETTETVTFRMLDKVVAIELIKQTLDNQIRPYMHEHGLKEDIVFSKYVKDLLERTGDKISYLGEAQWEAKTISVISCISGAKEKCDAILETMKWAPIPWTTKISNLVDSGLNLNHPRVEDLKKQCQLVEVKKLILKYEFDNVQSPSEDRTEIQSLLHFILSHNRDGCMEDALRVMAAYNLSIESELYYFRLRILILKHQELEKAMDLLKILPKNHGYSYGLRIVNSLKIFLDDTPEYTDKDCNTESHKMQRACTKAAVYIIQYLLPFTQDRFEVEELQSLLVTMQKLQALQVEYDKYLTVKQYLDSSYRDSVMLEFMTEFYIQRSKQQKEATNYASVYRLAHILQIGRVKLVRELILEALRTNSIQSAFEMCSELLEFEPSEEAADSWLQVAFACLHKQTTVEDIMQLRKLCTLTHQLASQAITYCSKDRLMQYSNLCKVSWLAVAVDQQCETSDFSAFTQDEDWYSSCDTPCDLVIKCSWDSTFYEDGLVMNSDVVMPLVATYGVVQFTLNDETNRDLEEAVENKSTEQLVNGESEEEVRRNKTTLQSMATKVYPLIEHLKDSNHLELAYQYLVDFFDTATKYVAQFDMGIPVENLRIEREKAFLQKMGSVIKEWSKELITGLLIKIFNCPKVDHKLALTFVVIMSRKEGLEAIMKIIKSSGNNYKRLKAVANVGISIGHLHKDTDVTIRCTSLEKDASWGHRLSKIKINFKDAFMSPVSAKLSLLPQIAQCETADVNLIKDFCSAYDIEVDVGLLMYLDKMFSFSESASNKDTSLICKAAAVIKEITSSTLLFEKLKTIYSKMDAYNYEALEVLLQSMQNIEKDNKRETGLRLLEYLKVYNRCSEPSEYELKYNPHGEEELSSVMNPLASSSKTRLPFHPFMEGDKWKIITPELQKDTVHTWLTIAKLLKLPADQIYMLTARNMVLRYVSATKESTIKDKSQWNWNVKDCNITLLTDVHKLLCGVSTCELSLACASWMASELPLGAEKVKTLESCVKYAELWHGAAESESTKQKAKAAFVKFTGMWHRLATEQVLFLHNIKDTKFIKLSNNVEKLLLKLFEHPCIVSCDLEQINIHEIAEEIASINNINLNKLKWSLLNRWLPSSASKQIDTDSTMTFDFDKLKFGGESEMSPEDDDDDDNLKRVLYLLQRGSEEENVMYLLNFASNKNETDQSTSVSNMCRIRALQCVLKLGNQDFILKNCQKTVADIGKLMLTLNYLVELEKLHILHSVKTFEDANKEGLIKGIWRNHKHQKSAALLVSSLCLNYNIHEIQLWNSVLQQIYSFGLLEQLEYILHRLAGIKDMRLIPVLPKMWQAILSTPLTKVAAPLNLDQTEKCVKYFNLVQLCPVLYDVDLMRMAKLYYEIDLPACALGCGLMSERDKQQILQMIACDVEKLMENAKQLLKVGLDLSMFHSIMSWCGDKQN